MILLRRIVLKIETSKNTEIVCWWLVQLAITTHSCGGYLKYLQYRANYYTYYVLPLFVGTSLPPWFMVYFESFQKMEPSALQYSSTVLVVVVVQ